MARDAWLPLVCSTLACFLVWWGTEHVPWGTEANQPSHTVNRLVASIRGGQPLMVASNDQYPAVAAEKTDDTLTLIDLPGISQETLGKHWAQLTPTERDEFMALFAQLLIHVAFPQSASFFQKLKMTMTAEHIRGEKATVSTYVEHAVEGKIDIDYRLSRENRGWRIYDVELDGVSLSRNLRGQFQQIIRHSSYAELLRRMRDKLEHATTPSPS